MAEKKTVKNKRYFDFSLLFITMFIIAFGLVMVYSASSYDAALSFDGDSTYYLRRQIYSVIAGCALMAVTMFFPYKLYKKFYWVGILFSAFMILLIIPLGYEANDAKRWIRFGSLSIQPAEICKPAAIIFVSTLLAKMSPKVREKWKGFWFPMVPVGILCLMVLIITKNLSSAIIIGGIGLLIVWIGAKKNIWPPIATLVMLLFALSIVMFLKFGKVPDGLGFRLERVLAWLDPEKYYEGKGYQILQSLYGIGSGGIFGKHLGKSMQKMGFLSEAKNDMIFSVICEELGLVGGFSVIAMYVLLLWKIRDVSLYCKDYFGNLLITGIFAHIAIQVVMNIAVATNIMPNTGVSLPFISYGGSSLMILMAEMGIVFNIGRYAKFAEEEPDDEEETPEAD